ncbi:hypothetical protein ABH905_004063 [Pseudomonas frederiksbergensis]
MPRGSMITSEREPPVVKGNPRPKADIMCLANLEQFTDVKIKSGHGLPGVQTGYSPAPYAAANERRRS